MPPVMFSVITKYHKGRHSLFLYNSEIFYAFTQDILRSRFLLCTVKKIHYFSCRLRFKPPKPSNNVASVSPSVSAAISDHRVSPVCGNRLVVSA